MHLRIFSSFAAALLFAFPAHAAEKLHVVASFSILGDFVHEVGGDDISLTTLVGANGDSHEYEPTPADAKTLAQADIVFVNGLGLEGWLERLIKSSGYKGEISIATQNIAQKSNDPHAWQNVANAKIYVQNIAIALSEKDPAHATHFKQNAASYSKKLDALDSWVKTQINTVPAAKRKVISTHDAFGYFAKAYGVEFLAPVGMSTESQASAADVAKLIDQMRSQHITALFFENMTDSRLIKQLQKDANATIGGTLYSDALSKPEEGAGSYIQMVQHNVPLLVLGMKNNPGK